MNNRGNTDEAIQKLNDLRGVMAIWIVLGHLAVSMTSQKNIFLLMQKADLAIVGLFFFLSGYGLEKSLERKKDYLKTFLPKKFLRLLLMTWVQFGVTELSFYFLRFPNDVSGVREVIGKYVLYLNWYIWELALMYLIFWISHIIFRDKKAYFTAALLTLALTVILYHTQGAFASTFSCLAFPGGMIMYSVRHKIEKAAKSRYGEMFIALLILTGFTTISMVLPKESFVTVLLKNLFCVCFAYFATLIFLRTGPDSKVLRYLSRMSPEIYLYQFPASGVTVALALRHKGMERGLSYAAVTFLLTMAMAFVIYLLRRLVERMIRDEK